MKFVSRGLDFIPQILWRFRNEFCSVQKRLQTDVWTRAHLDCSSARGDRKRKRKRKKYHRHQSVHPGSLSLLPLVSLILRARAQRVSVIRVKSRASVRRSLEVFGGLWVLLGVTGWAPEPRPAGATRSGPSPSSPAPKSPAGRQSVGDTRTPRHHHHHHHEYIDLFVFQRFLLSLTTWRHLLIWPRFARFSLNELKNMKPSRTDVSCGHELEEMS